MSEQHFDLTSLIDKTQRICRRYLGNANVDISKALTPEQTAARIQSLVIEAAKKASQFEFEQSYPDDNPWLHNGFGGLSLQRVIEEQQLATQPHSASGEEWGIMARVACGDDWFDVPIALELSQDATANILAMMEGAEASFVLTDLIAQVFKGADFSVRLHADNWAQLREIAQDGLLDLPAAMEFRRPAVWDIFRARLCDVEPDVWPEISEREFAARYAKSMRYDRALISSCQNLVGRVARAKFTAYSEDWLMWHQSMLDTLAIIGNPSTLQGMSVILQHVAEEPCVDGGWRAVAHHNLLVAYGLHPTAAARLLDEVTANPWRYFDLPDEGEKRHRLLGVAAIQDSSLSAYRVSMVGRTDAYDFDHGPREAVAA